MTEETCKHGVSIIDMCQACEMEAYDKAIRAQWAEIDAPGGAISAKSDGMMGPFFESHNSRSAPINPSSRGDVDVPESVLEGIALFRKYMRLDKEEVAFDGPQFRACLTAAVTAGIKVCHKPIIFFAGPTDVGKTTRACFLVSATRLPATASGGVAYTADTLQKNIFAFPRNIQDHHLISSKWDGALYDDIQTTDNAIYKMICLTSTGGSMPVRKLYTNDEVLAIGSSMLVVYTGINTADMPPDLLNRHIILNVEAIPDADMEDEDVLLERFCVDLPKIQLAVLYLRQHVQLQLADKRLKRPAIPRQCRLRSFARAGYIISKAMGWPSFIDDYAQLATETLAAAGPSETHRTKTQPYDSSAAVWWAGKAVAAGFYARTTAALMLELKTDYPDLSKQIGGDENMGKCLGRLKFRLAPLGWVINDKRAGDGHLWSIAPPPKKLAA